MTNLQIDRALALAIGWQECELRDLGGSLSIDIGEWRTFSHKDPAVIWPIAERFDCFPRFVGRWFAYVQKYDETGADLVVDASWSDIAATAVALAVIEANPYGVPTK